MVISKTSAPFFFHFNLYFKVRVKKKPYRKLSRISDLFKMISREKYCFLFSFHFLIFPLKIFTVIINTLECTKGTHLICSFNVKSHPLYVNRESKKANCKRNYAVQ